MEYRDLRKVGRDGRKEIRRQVVQLKKMGEKFRFMIYQDTKPAAADPVYGAPDSRFKTEGVPASGQSESDLVQKSRHLQLTEKE